MVRRSPELVHHDVRVDVVAEGAAGMARLMASAARWRPGDGVVLAERRRQFGVSPPGPNSSARTRPTLVSRNRRAKARPCVDQLAAFSIVKAAMPSSRGSSPAA